MTYEISEDGRSLWKVNDNPLWLKLQKCIRLFSEEHTELAKINKYVCDHPCWKVKYNPVTNKWEHKEYTDKMNGVSLFAMRKLASIIQETHFEKQLIDYTFKYSYLKYARVGLHSHNGCIIALMRKHKYYHVNMQYIPSLDFPTPPPLPSSLSASDDDDEKLMQNWRIKWGIGARGDAKTLLKMADKVYRDRLKKCRELHKWLCQILYLDQGELRIECTSYIQ